MSVFRNNEFLINIRPSVYKIKLATNGGEQVSNMVGDIPNFGLVWYNLHSLANILSLVVVRKNNRVTMESNKEITIIVHRNDGTTLNFLECNSGIYYYYTTVVQ